MLVIEDAHWADESSLDLIAFWARTLLRGRLLLIVTGRDVGVDDNYLERVAELGRIPGATVIHLSPLDIEDVDAQARALDESVTDELMDDVRRLSEGNPLYVEEPWPRVVTGCSEACASTWPEGRTGSNLGQGDLEPRLDGGPPL